MQIGAINPVNFQGTVRRKPTEKPTLGTVGDAIEKANNNVHLLTVILGTGTTAVALTKGKNCVSVLTRALATTGEGVSKALVKGTTSLINAVNKKGTKLDSSNAVKGIEKAANALRADGVVNDKIVGGVKEFTSKILGEKAGEKAAKFLVDNKMASALGLAQGVAAGAIGLGIVDKATYKFETALDDYDIRKAAKKDGTLSFLKTAVDLTQTAIQAGAGA